MLYLKQSLGGIGRSLHDHAVTAFHGPYRWLKLGMYVALFVLPGGSLGVLLVAWLGHRRTRRAAGFRPQTAPVAARPRSAADARSPISPTAPAAARSAGCRAAPGRHGAACADATASARSIASKAARPLSARR
jgi:hypothetical protein